jgi:hypothetical protein
LEWLSSKTKTNVDKDATKQEPLYIVGGNVDSYNHYGKQYGELLKN